MNQLNHNYACAGIMVLVAYAFYCAGNVFINHVFPDGALFASIVGTVLLIFGYSTGRIHEAVKQINEGAKALDTPKKKKASKIKGKVP